jgi:NAD(P)-dependent dehydrogenase (short-subunit alcohol dehydrogenase family)
MGVLEGKVVVISRGTSGIGARAAALFVDQGASVVMGGRRQVEGRELAGRLGSRAHFVRSDAGVESDVETLIGATIDSFGRLDILVNNAGIGSPSAGGWSAITLDRFWAVLAFHVDGVAAGIKHAAPVMIDRGSGTIVNITSIGTPHGHRTGVEYSTARAAVIHMTQWAAQELGPFGIRVNSVSPVAGPVDASGRGAGTVANGVGHTPPDVGRVLLALAAERPAYANGQNIVVGAEAGWSGSVANHGGFPAGVTARRPVSFSVDERKRLANHLAS